jgi:hypothetical protein
LGIDDQRRMGLVGDGGSEKLRVWLGVVFGPR